MTQVVQDLNNSVPLIKGKPTYVRGDVKRPERSGELKDVTANLIVRDAGGGILAKLNPMNRGRKLTVKEYPDRLDLKESFLFVLPLNAGNGTVKFEFKAAPDQLVRCKNHGGDCIEQVTFEEVPSPKVTFVRVAWSQNGGPPHRPGTAALRSTMEEILAMLPIARLDGRMLPRELPWSFSDGPLEADWARLIEELSALKRTKELFEFRAPDDIYYGILEDKPSKSVWNGLSQLSGNVGASYFDELRPQTGAHEWAHLFGRFHHKGSECPEVQEPLDGSYPYPDGYISQALDGPNAFYGIDTYPKLQIEIPASYDLMTYCSLRWISDYTYKGIIAKLGASPANAVSASIKADEGIVLVSGLITPTENSGSIHSVINTETAGAIATPAPGPAAIRFEDAGGQALATHSFEPGALSESTNQVFALLLPRHAGAARIVLLRNGVELAARTASAHAPTVTVLSPNGGESLAGPTATLTWSANDADGDALEYVIQYSTDAGATWEVLHSGWPATSYELYMDTIPGSDQALIRVLANDGFYTSQDQSDATFGVVKKPPIANIRAIDPITTYVDGQLINFAGDAFDYEDGQIPEAALNWSPTRTGPWVAAARCRSMPAS